MARHAGGERSVADHDAELDVAVEGGVGEVRRGREDRLAVRDHSRCVEHAGGTVELDRPGVVVDAGPRLAGLVRGPELIGESAHEPISGGGVASSSLYVQQ